MRKRTNGVDLHPETVDPYSSTGGVVVSSVVVSSVVVSSVVVSSLDLSQPVRIVLPHRIRPTTLNIANAFRMIDLRFKVSIVIGMQPSRLSILEAVPYTIGVLLASSARGASLAATA